MTDPKHARTQDEHSPTPWRVGFYDGSGSGGTEGMFPEGAWILSEHEPNQSTEVDVIVRGGNLEIPYGVVLPADAHHIVACVNAHDALVEALEGMLEASGYLPPDYLTPAMVAARGKAIAALDAAKGAKRT